jgi:hypothetical protein
MHRMNGPALYCSDVNQSWYNYGLRHRINGPAVEYYGCKYWYFYNQCYPKVEYEIIMYYYNLYSSIIKEFTYMT